MNLSNSKFLRTFNINTNSDELVWHRDKKDRIVRIISGEAWEFQFDNELPVVLKPGDVLFIPKETYHRIKKGSTDLKILIEEL